MSTPLFLLLGLTIATCVIAYWADNLGKKLGKKRVTILGLRPRQTATLMTMLSSVAIMFFTFLVLLVTNSSLRGALLRYDEERAANLRLREDNRQLRDDQNILQNQAQAARRQATSARQQAETSRQQAEAAGKALTSTRTRLAYEQEQLKAAQMQEKAARSGERAAKLNAQQAGQRLSTTKNQLRLVDGRLNDAQQELKKLNRRLASAREAAEKARIAAQNARSQEQNAKKRYADATAKYTAESAKFIADTARLMAEEQRLNAEVTKLETQRNRLQLVKTQLETFDTSVLAGWVFDARLIAPRTTATEVATQLRQMVEQVSRVVGDSDAKRTLRVVLPDGSRRLTDDEIIRNLAQYLAPFTVPVSVRLVSTRNHAQAEPEIEAALVPVPGRVVLARGETLAETLVDGTQSDVRIFGQLYRLLTRSEAVAREHGVNPFLREEKEEYFYAEDTNERIFEALHRIQKMKVPVQVRLVAATDISAIDRLSVRFEISPSASS